jgi:hypothetical protein
MRHMSELSPGSTGDTWNAPGEDSSYSVTWGGEIIWNPA